MPIITVSSKGQIVIPKKIRKDLGIKPGQKVSLQVIDSQRIELLPLPENPIEAFCGIFKEGSSLTEALLKERREEFKREEAKVARFVRLTGLSKKRK